MEQQDDSLEGQIVLEEEVDENYEPTEQGQEELFVCTVTGHQLLNRYIETLAVLASQRYWSMHSGWGWIHKQRR